MNVNNTRRATILLCSSAVVVLATSAFAKPIHHHRHRAAQTMQVANGPLGGGADRDVRYSGSLAQAAMQPAGDNVGRSRRHVRRSMAEARVRAQSHAKSADGGPTSNALVAEARKYIGTNPTGRGSLWC